MFLDRRSVLFAVVGLLPAAVASTACAGGSSAGGDDGGIVSDGDTQPATEPAATAAAPAASLRGEVLTYEGKAISGATVTFQSLDNPPQPFPDIAPVTGADGRFSATLPAGRYRVTAVTPSGSRKSRDTTIDAARVRDFRIWLAR